MLTIIVLGEVFVNPLWVCDLVLVPIAFIVYLNIFRESHTPMVIKLDCFLNV